jgi:dTMP kinase
LTNSKEIDDRKLHTLFSQNRWEFKDTILDHLNSGTCIIADRYAFSGVAYSVAKGLDFDWCRECDEGLPAPDLVIFLDIDPSIAASRGDYGKERYEKLEFQQKVWFNKILSTCKVREAYKKMFASDCSKWKVIDATLDIEDIHKQILGETWASMNHFSTFPVGKLWKDA